MGKKSALAEHILCVQDSVKCFVSESESEIEVTQSCLTLCNPMDYSPQGSSVHGILQARILEWVAIPFSRELNQGFLHWQVDSLPSEQPGKL